MRRTACRACSRSTCSTPAVLGWSEGLRAGRGHPARPYLHLRRITASGRARISRCGCACPCRCAALRRPPSCTPSGRRLNAPSLEAYIAAKAENTLQQRDAFPGAPDQPHRRPSRHVQPDGRRVPAGRRLARRSCCWPDRSPTPTGPTIRSCAEQRQGIGLDRALELFAAYGHDMRPAASANNN